MENKLYELRQDVISPVLNIKKGECKLASEWKELMDIGEHSLNNKEWFREVENPIFNREDLIGAVYDIIIKLKRLPKLGPVGLSHQYGDMLDSFMSGSDEKNRKMIEMLVDDYLKNKV